MRLVIIESPYAGGVSEHIMYARACIHDSILRGEAPFASHLLYTQPGILDDSDPEARKQGIELGFEWRSVAGLTAVYTDLGISNGMKLGIVHAEGIGHEIEFRQIGRGPVE